MPLSPKLLPQCTPRGPLLSYSGTKADGEEEVSQPGVPQRKKVLDDPSRDSPCIYNILYTPLTHTQDLRMHIVYTLLLHLSWSWFYISL